ncbi:MAG: hypothetical protein R3F62_12460 [Planctomycetota bacterium]
MNEHADDAPEGPSLEEILAERCPRMTPIRGTPTLFTLNGFGLTLYGARDRDPVTGTYVKTQYLAALFLPVLAIGAYRVADAPRGGWYFLGKEPLGPLAKAWTFAVLAVGLTFLAAVGWAVHTSSPAYRAQETLTQAEAYLAEGDRLDAAQSFAFLAHGPLSARGQTALSALLAEEPQGELGAAARLVCTVRDSAYGAGLVQPEAARLAQAAVAGAGADPEGALALLDALPQDDPAVIAAREPALEAALAATPADPERASALALLYEARDELERCEAILRPAAAGLAGHEGARILGQILSERGEVEEAHRLLQPYVEARLTELHAAEAAYEQTQESVWQSSLDRLRQGAAGPAWYQSYDAADEATQQAMVQEWIAPHLENSSQLAAARGRLQDAARVVPVALDLGIVKLQRAQSLEDPEARRAELEGAEQVFVAIQGVAQDSPMFQLHLGTVYYWLGKHDEGHTLYEELLASTERAPNVLLRVAHELRGVGAGSEARVLAEEAFGAAEDDAVRYEAAGLRAVLAGDTEDEIAWLEKGDPQNAFARAQLRSAQGNQALGDGDEDAAAAHYRAALEAYAKVPESQSTLNNAALVYQRLHQIRRDPADFLKAVDMLEQAERLDSRDPIVLGNLAGELLRRAGLAAVGDALELRTLRSGPDAAQLAQLYRTQAEREALEGRLIQHADFTGGVERLNKLVVLSPQNAQIYRSLLEAYAYRYDLEQHRALLAALEAVNLDHTDYAAAVAGWLVGEDPEEAERYAANRKRSRERAARVVASARASDHAPTLAAALIAQTWEELGGHAYGEELPLDEAVGLAEEAYALLPSHRATDALVGALLARTTARLSAAHPAFATLLAENRRSVAAFSLPLLALEHPAAELRAAAQADPDLQRTVELVAALGADDPRSLRPWDWALLSGAGAPAAAEAQAVLREDAVLPLRLRARILLEPLSTDAALSLAWYHRALGDDDAAEATLAAARERGAPLPW